MPVAFTQTDGNQHQPKEHINSSNNRITKLQLYLAYHNNQRLSLNITLYELADWM